MEKILIKGRDKLNKISKQIAEGSPNTVSTFFFYEPKMPKEVRKEMKK